MKQRISNLHIAELSQEQADKLRDWWQPQEGDYIATGDHEEMIYYVNGVNRSKSLPLLNIGQMIQLLEETDSACSMQRSGNQWIVNGRFRDSELCDALWQALTDCL